MIEPKAARSSWAKNIDKIVEDVLVEGEEVLLRGRIHWGVYWKSFAVILIALYITFFVVQEIGLILMIFGFLMAAHAVMAKHFLLLVLTNKRVLARYGILQVDFVDMRFRNIESVELERMLPGFLLGYANVVVMGTGQRYIVIPFVSNGPEFRRKFNELTLNEEEKLSDRKSDKAKDNSDNGDDE